MVAGERSAMPSDRAASSGQWTAARRAQPPQKKKTGAQRNAGHSGRRKWVLDLGSTRCRLEGYFLSPGVTAGWSVRICARATTGGVDMWQL